MAFRGLHLFRRLTIKLIELHRLMHDLFYSVKNFKIVWPSTVKIDVFSGYCYGDCIADQRVGKKTFFYGCSINI